MELEVADRTGLLRDTRSFSTVANQPRYTLPDDVLDVESCIYQPTREHWTLPYEDRDRMVSYLYQTGIPQMFTSYRGKQQVGFWPITSTAAQSTALNGALTAAATTVTVDSTDSFGQQGRITIDDEIISYTGTTSTTFTGCTRGAENTVAVSHSDDATVTWRNVELTAILKPKPMAVLYTTGTVVTTNASKTVTGTSTNWSDAKIVKAGQWFGGGSLETTPTAATFPLHWYKVTSVDSNTQLTLTLAFNEEALSASNYIVTDPSDFPEEYGPLILTGMLSRALFAVRSPMFTVKDAEYQRLMKEAEGDVNVKEYVPIMRLRGGPARVGVQPSTADGGYYPYYPRP